jgi:hypothetical protein
VCRECRAANAPGRRFCRRCGTSLAEVVVVAVAPRLPWWRRAWRLMVIRLFPPAPEYRAGQRPPRGRRARRGVGWVLFRVAMATALIVALVPGLRHRAGDDMREAYRSVKDALTESYSPVRPVAVTATSSLPGHGPNLAADRLSNTYWAEGTVSDGEGQTLVFNFDPPVSLDRVIVTAGASGSDDAFLSQPRPRVLHVVYDSGGTDDIVLKDVPTPQTFSLAAKEVTEIQLQITLVYRSTTGQACSISEVEFFTRS